MAQRTAARRMAIKGLLLGVALGGGWVFADTSSPPKDWHLSSQTPGEARNYEASVDRGIAYDGSASALLKSKTRDTNTQATLMQAVAAGEFVGKRVSFSAWLRTRDLARRAGLWLRAEDGDGSIIAFRNIQTPGASGGSVHGDTEWARVEIDVDIPDSAKALYYGIQMEGSGAVWIDHVQLVASGNAQLEGPGRLSAVSNPHRTPPKLLPRPANLNFED